MDTMNKPFEGGSPIIGGNPGRVIDNPPVAREENFVPGQDVEGLFPINKFLADIQAGKKVTLSMKNFVALNGSRYKHGVIEPKSNGGGLIQFFVGGSKWELEFAFEDLSYDETKGSVIIGA